MLRNQGVNNFVREGLCTDMADSSPFSLATGSPARLVGTRSREMRVSTVRDASGVGQVAVFRSARKNCSESSQFGSSLHYCRRAIAGVSPVPALSVSAPSVSEGNLNVRRGRMFASSLLARLKRCASSTRSIAARTHSLGNHAWGNGSRSDRSRHVRMIWSSSRSALRRFALQGLCGWVLPPQ